MQNYAVKCDFLLFDNGSDCVGERLNGIDSEGTAQRLRGNAGTTVKVNFAYI